MRCVNGSPCIRWSGQNKIRGLQAASEVQRETALRIDLPGIPGAEVAAGGDAAEEASLSWTASRNRCVRGLSDPGLPMLVQ